MSSEESAKMKRFLSNLQSEGQVMLTTCLESWILEFSEQNHRKVVSTLKNVLSEQPHPLHHNLSLQSFLCGCIHNRASLEATVHPFKHNSLGTVFILLLHKQTN